MTESIRNEIVNGNIPKSTVKVTFDIRSKSNKRIGLISTIHYHDELELIPIYDGEMCALVDGKEYKARAGEVIFINASVPHETYSNIGVGESALIQFNENEFLDSEITKITKYSARLKNLSGDGITVLRSKEFFNIVDDIIRESKNKSTAYELYVRSGIYKVLGFLYRNEMLSDSEEMYKTKEVQKILPVLSHINKHYDEDITLEEMSAMLGFDQSYFCRIFKVATGATFTEYLNFVRICKAEKLLSRTEKSVLEISEVVGFSSVSYFNRIFKRYKNCSPRQYRSARYIK